jgi:hypothetical protein
MTRRTPPERVQQVLKLHLAGRTVLEIKRETKLCTNTVRRLLADRGLKPNHLTEGHIGGLRSTALTRRISYDTVDSDFDEGLS